MALASPTRGSSSLDRFMRIGSSGGKNSTATHSLTVYSKSPTKPKRLQSAHYDETTGTWRCKSCGWTYPNPEPHHHQRREHKKICPGGLTVQRWLSHGSGLSTEDTDSHDTSSVVDKPTMPETLDKATTKLSLGQKDKPFQDRFDRVDSSALETSEFVATSNDSGSGSKEGRDIDMEAPLSLGSQNEPDRLKGDQPTPFSDENGVKEQAKDLGEGFEWREPSVTAADNQAKGMRESEEGEMSIRVDDNAQKENPELLQDGEESQLTVTEDGNAEKPREEMGEGSSGTHLVLTASENVLREQDEDVGMEEAIPSSDQDGKDDVKQCGPVAIAGDEHQSGQLLARDLGVEVLENATFQVQSDNPENGAEEVGDLHRHVNERIGAALSEADAEAEVISGRPKASRGRENFSGMWHVWERIVRGEDRFGEKKMSPMLPDIDVAGQPFSVGRLTSHCQPDHLDNESADTSAPIPEHAEAVMNSDQDAGNEIGSQPEGLDWQSLLDKSVDKHRGNSVSSTSADHDFNPDQDWPGLIPGLDQEQGGNGNQVASTTPASQHQTDRPNKIPVRLSAAEANWDDWDDVIKEVPTLTDGLTSKTTEDPEPSSGERHTLGVESLGGGDVHEPGEGKTGTILESKSAEDVVDTVPPGLPVLIPKVERSDWLIDFSEPSVENNSGTANEAIPALAVSTPKDEPHGTNFFDLLLLNEDSGQEQGASSSDSIPVTFVSETSQTSEVLSKWSSALRNWEDWEDVVRENECVNGVEKKRPVLESDLGGGKLQGGIEAPNLSDICIVERGIIKPEGSGEAPKSPPVANNSSAAENWGQGVEGLNQEQQPDAMTTSDPDDADALFRLPKPYWVPRVAGNSSSNNGEFPQSGLGQTEGKKGVHVGEDTSRPESGHAFVETLPSAQREWEDWEVVQKNEYSSPSFEDAHDGELSSESEDPNGHKRAVNLPVGKRAWEDWEDLVKSNYMVLDGPGGESLIFKRASDARGSQLSTKSSRGRESPSFEEPDEDGESPRLRRRRQPQSFDEDKSPSLRTLKGASPRGVVTPGYFQGFDTTPRSLPASSPRKPEAEDLPSLVLTRRPLLYRDSRRDYTSEVEDVDVASDSPNLIVHHHDHNLHDHQAALKYDVEKVLRGQTMYELICPICGALITRKIVIRKKKRRFISAGDQNSEITPVKDDGDKTPRSDTSSELDYASAGWKGGIRPCFGYLFGS